MNEEVGMNEILDNHTRLPDRFKVFRKLDLNLFIVFASIYEQGSITAAGKALGITQPATSHALGRLRIALDDDLFVRRGNSLVATPFAKNILGDVHDALDILRAGPLREKHFEPATAVVNFRLSMPAGMEMFLFPKLLGRLSKDAPNVFMTSVNLPRAEIESELTLGELDMAIVAEVPLSLDIRRTTLRADELVVVARNGNPITAKGLDKNIYLAARHIMINVRNSGSGIEDYELARIGEKRTIVARCLTVSAALKSAVETDYLVTLGRAQLQAMDPNHDLDVFDFPFAPQGLEALLLWHESLDDDPANMWLRNMIINHYKL